jgi:glycosyltransferase involved in cell wall biosynthesis
VLAPEISVLLPAFDAASTLAAALRSVQRQTEQRWECVVVDDGSRDGTLALANAMAREDERIRVVAMSHAGIVTALRAGIAECRAPLIARMDADDLMSRRRLQLQRGALDGAPELAAVGCHVRLFPRAGLREGRLNYELWLSSICTPEAVQREAFVECPIAHPTLMIRREVLAAFDYRELGWPEDYDLVLRLLEAGHRIGMVPERLLHWRDGEGRLSRKQPAAILELHPGRLGQIIRGVRARRPEALPSLPRMPLIVSVAGLGPRTEIRAALSQMSFVETRDYVCAA